MERFCIKEIKAAFNWSRLVDSVVVAAHPKAAAEILRFSLEAERFQGFCGPVDALFVRIRIERDS